jgi:ABC-type phosphate transport system substrate-binding protein
MNLIVQPNLKEASSHNVVALIIAIILLSILLSCSSNASSPDIIYTTGPDEISNLINTLNDEYFIFTSGKTEIVTEFSNSNDGFQLLCSGKSHMAYSSRPITQSESTYCNDSSISFIELPLTTQPIIVATNIANTVTECVTLNDMKNIWSNPNYLLQGEEMHLYGPPLNSDLSSYLSREFNTEIHNTKHNTNKNNGTLIIDVINDIHSIAVLNYSIYKPSAQYLKALPVSISNTGCIAPTSSSVNDREYNVFSRTIFVYLRTDLLKNLYFNKFAQYLLDQQTINHIKSANYIPLDSTVYADNRNLLKNKTSGSLHMHKNKKSGDINK